MHTVPINGLRVRIKRLMATVRGPALKYRGVSSQQGLRTTGGQDWGRLYSSLWPFWVFMERDLTRGAPYLSLQLIWQAAGDPLPLFVSDHRGLSIPYDLPYLAPVRTPHLEGKGKYSPWYPPILVLHLVMGCGVNSTLRQQGCLRPALLIPSHSRRCWRTQRPEKVQRSHLPGPFRQD